MKSSQIQHVATLLLEKREKSFQQHFIYFRGNLELSAGGEYVLPLYPLHISLASKVQMQGSFCCCRRNNSVLLNAWLRYLQVHIQSQRLLHLANAVALFSGHKEQLHVFSLKCFLFETEALSAIESTKSNSPRGSLLSILHMNCTAGTMKAKLLLFYGCKKGLQ